MNSTPRFAAAIALVACLALASSSQAAPVLSMDFGVAASPLQTGFLSMAGPSSSPAAAGSFGLYTVNLAGQGFFNSTNTQADNADPSVRDLYRDYYYNNSTTYGQGVSLQVAGFAPGNYNLTLFTYDAGNPNPTVTEWTPMANTSGATTYITNVATPGPTALLDPDNSAVVPVTTTTGTIDVFGTSNPAGFPSGNGGTRLNGFKIDDGTSELLAVDFAVGSPVIAGFTGGHGATSQATYTETVGPFTVGLEGQGFFHSGNAGRLANLGPDVRGFFGDYYYNNSTAPDVGVTLTIEGVQPNTDYDLKLWSYDNDHISPGTPTTWTPTGDTTGDVANILNIRDPYPQSLDTNTDTIRVRSTTSTLTIFGTTTSGNGGTRLNGFQLTVVPEPAAALLAGMATLALAACGRFRRQ